MSRQFFNHLTKYLIIFLTAKIACAQKPTTELAFQGFTGLLNIPNAEVPHAGKFNLQLNTEPNIALSNQLTRNALLSFGFLPNLEFAGRVWIQDGPDSNASARDLSANIKLQLLAGRRSLAIGLQDLGGGAPNFRTSYLVGSQRFGPTRVSFGYGTGPDRMEGIFGGVEWTVSNSLDLLAEHDTLDNNLGIRLHTPSHWFDHGIRLSFIGKQAIGVSNNDNFEFGIGLTIPLGSNHHSDQPITLSTSQPKHLANAQIALSTSQPKHLANAQIALSTSQPKHLANAQNTTNVASTEVISPSTEWRDQVTSLPHPLTQLPSSAPTDTDISALQTLGLDIVDLGFENIRLGVNDTDIYVEYENHRYNHNELDALGLVMGTVAVKAPSALRTMVIVMKKDNLPVLEVKVPRAGYLDFLVGPRNAKNLAIWPPSVGALWSQMTIRAVTNPSIKNIRWVSLAEQNKPWARITLGPGLRYFLATEVSVFDYALTLNPEIEIPLWKGGVLSAAWQIPITHSENLDDDKFFGFFRPKQEMTHLWLQQGLRPSADVFDLIGVGMHYRDKANYVGIFNDVAWIPGAGNHRLRAQLGYFNNNGNPMDQWYLEEHNHRKIYVGSYRYLYAPWDLSLEASFGQFWYKDNGMLLKATRFFGDTSVAIYYKDDGEWRAGGVEFTLPLTPRRGMKPKSFSVTGKENWMINLETTISTPGETNIVNPNLLTIPKLTRTLDRNYLNRDRLSVDYIRTHLLRLREVYARWGEK